MYRRIVLTVIAVTLALSAIILSPFPAQAGSWSVGMFTVYEQDKCDWAGRHCRWVATELNFHPRGVCYYITFDGKKFTDILRQYGYNGGLNDYLTMERNSSKPGHKTYGWGIPSRMAWDYNWRDNSKWRFYKC